MNRQTRILIVIAFALAAGAVLWCRSDNRLAGTYTPDVDATYPLWNDKYGFSRESVENAFQQMFDSQPMILTGHDMSFSSEKGIATHRFVVLWKSAESSLIAYSFHSLYRLELAPDGLWISQKRVFGYPRYALSWKMKRQEAPASASSVRDPRVMPDAHAPDAPREPVR